MRHRIDSIFAFGIFGLVLFGIVMIYSASVIVALRDFSDPQFFFKREIIYAIIGLAGMAVLSTVDYQIWQKNAKWLLLISMVLLLSVFIFSKGEINGAHRWIVIGGFSFQPAELVKFTFTAYLAAWFVRQRSEITSFTNTFLPFVGITGAIAFLMLQQPDFGTLTVIIASALAVYFVAGMSLKHLLIGLGILIIGLSLILAAPYRRARLESFFNPDSGNDAATYQIKNISIAIGSGGWFGLGFGESKQKRLFLPEPHNDSIFAIIVEELGFVVASLVILLIGLVIYRGYRIAARAPDMFAKLLAVGITTWFAYQATLNLAAMLQLVPLKGVPLPFISYGGTNLIISLLAAGVLLNISRYLKDDSESPKKEKAIHHSQRLV